MRSKKVLVKQNPDVPQRRDTAPDLSSVGGGGTGARRRGTAPDLGGGGGGGGSEGGRLSIGTAMNQLEMLKAVTGMSDEELQWLMDSKAGNAFLIAEKKKEAAESAYDKALYDSGALQQRLRQLDDRQIEMALKKLSKLEKRPGDPVTNAANASTTSTDVSNEELSEEELEATILTLTTKLAKAHEKVAALLTPEEKNSEKSARGGVGEESGRVVLCDAVKHVLKQTSYSKVPKSARVAREKIESEIKQTKDAAAKTQKDMDRVLSRIELWQSRMDGAPQKQAELDKRNQEWYVTNEEKNQAALRQMRSFIPTNIASISVPELRELVCQNGGLFPLELMLYLKECKLLHWLVTHQSEIERANFLNGNHARHFASLEGYDICELRALSCVLPAKFENDRDGKKAAWLADFTKRVRELVAREDGDTVKGGWDPVSNARRINKLPALEPHLARRALYFYPGAAEVEARLAKYEERRQRLANKLAAVETIKGEVAELQDEYQAALSDSRSDELKKLYGKEQLTQNKEAAKADHEAKKRQLKTAEAAVVSSKRAISEAVPDEPTFRQETEAAALFLSERFTGDVGAVVDAGAKRPVIGCFESEPEITVAAVREVAKKLSAEEEARQRKMDLQNAMSARKDISDAAAREDESRAAAQATAEAERTLDVRRPVAVSDAVRKCLSAQFSERVVGSSKAALGGGGNGSVQGEGVDGLSNAETAPVPHAVTARPTSKRLQKLLAMKTAGSLSEAAGEAPSLTNGSRPPAPLGFMAELSARANKPAAPAAPLGFMAELSARANKPAAPAAPLGFMAELSARANKPAVPAAPAAPALGFAAELRAGSQSRSDENGEQREAKVPRASSQASSGDLLAELKKRMSSMETIH